MSEPSVAYLLMGYPRLSEIFIASEIYRLEQLGLPIKLFVLKAADEVNRHRVVEEIAAQPHYLPQCTSLSAVSAPAWLRTNLPAFRPALGRELRRHPHRVARAAAAATAQAFRSRQGWRPRKGMLKEFLRAVAFADQLADAPDVTHIHAHFGHGTTSVAWLTAMLTGLQYSFTGHAKDIYRTSLNPAGLLARKIADAAFVVTCTGVNREHLCGVSKASPVHLVYHGLNADFARLVDSERRPVAPERPRIISVGRLVPKKGFDVLVTAVAQLRDRGIDVDLVIAGENGDHAPVVRGLVASLGITDRVQFVGELSQHDLYAQYLQSTVFALACRVLDDGDRDGIPNVLMEAMAAGLPVVTTDVSAISELVLDGTTGMLAPSDDPAAFADALSKVLEDRTLAESLASNGRATIAGRFDGAISARQLHHLLTDAMAGAGR